MLKITHIYLDMDGVIADFNKRYVSLFGINPREAEKNKKFKTYFEQFIESGQFSTLDVMPGAMQGVDYLRKFPAPTQILSSTASEKNYDAISKQKMIWLQTHGITFNPLFVPGKRHKWKYATPTSIIIDDTQSVIQQWDEAGGIGILHTDWPSTISILNMYL